MAGLKVKIGADASQFERTMRGVKKQIGGVRSSIMGIAGAVGAIYAVNKAFDLMKTAARGAFEFIKSSSQAAATVENISVQFETLLGSADAAGKRMEELFEFAKTTPFEIKELAQVSTMMQGMTGGALAIGDGLRMVGDAAAAVNQPVGVVARNIALLYSGMTQGGEVAEATNQLMQYGLVTGQTKAELQEFVKAAKDGKVSFMSQEDAIRRLSEILGQTEGAMGRLAETTDGKMSMVKDAIFQVKNAFGQGFNEGFKEALDAATGFIPKFQKYMKEAGEGIGLAISNAVNGDLEMIEGIGKLIGTVIKRGIEIAMDEAKGGAAQGIYEWLEYGGYKK